MKAAGSAPLLIGIDWRTTMKIAFAGLRHGHIFALYEMAKNHSLYEIVGSFEDHPDYIASAEKQGVTVNYKTLDELVNDPSVEAVAIGSCFGDRGSVAIEALKHGKNVICDKPLCTSLEDLYEIERLAKERGLFVSCMYTMRFEKNMVAVRELIRSGALGEIVNVYFGGQHPLQYGRRPAWYYEDGKHGGVFNDIAIHGIDLLSFWFDGDIDSIQAARSWNKYADCESGFHDCGQFMLTLKNGAGVISDVSYAIPDGVEFGLPYYWQFFVWGTGGCLGFALSDKEIKYYVKGEKEPKTLEVKPISHDYLTDFYNLVNGSSDVVLPMNEVFRSTENTLKIQVFADK